MIFQSCLFKEQIGNITELHSIFFGVGQLSEKMVEKANYQENFLFTENQSSLFRQLNSL